MTPEVAVQKSSTSGVYKNTSNLYQLVLMASGTAPYSIANQDGSLIIGDLELSSGSAFARIYPFVPKVLLPPNFTLTDAGATPFNLMVMTGSLEDLRGYF